MRTPAMPVRVLFRVAAGPRLGFGHLVRARVLSRALGIARPALSMRGAGAARRVARRLGFHLLEGSADLAITRMRPAAVVVDDPAHESAARWRRACGRLGVPVASLHDLGLAFCAADLSIDGSLVVPDWPPRGRHLVGPRYAIVDPALRAWRGARRDPRRVLIALGGGARCTVARGLARAIHRLSPGTEVRIAAGFAATGRRESGVVWLPPLPGLASELAKCAVAVVAGGVSLYEAAVLSTPVVAWPVVRAQHPTVRAFARQTGAMAVLPGPGRPMRAARAVVSLLRPSYRRRPARPVVDGLGAARVASAIRHLAESRGAGGMA